jgi:hypothetical protein
VGAAAHHRRADLAHGARHNPSSWLPDDKKTMGQMNKRMKMGEDEAYEQQQTSTPAAPFLAIAIRCKSSNHSNASREKREIYGFDFLSPNDT